MKNKLEYTLGFTALILVIFTICNANLGSKINQINSNSVEFLIQSNFDISRAVATGNLMQDKLSLGLSLNKSLIDIITSKEYLIMFENRNQQTLSANSSFSDYKQEKAKLEPLAKKHTIIQLICNILAIANALLAIVLIGKRFVKQN